MQYPGFMQAFLSFAQSPAFAGVENFCCRVYPWIAAILMAAVLLWYLPRYFYEGYSGRYFARTHRDEPREDIRFMAFGSASAQSRIVGADDVRRVACAVANHTSDSHKRKRLGTAQP